MQTAGQAAGVRALMRQAGVTPRAAVGPGWAVLRSIAGLRGQARLMDPGQRPYPEGIRER